MKEKAKETFFILVSVLLLLNKTGKLFLHGVEKEVSLSVSVINEIALEIVLSSFIIPQILWLHFRWITAAIGGSTALK